MSRSVDYTTPVAHMSEVDLIENALAYHKAQLMEMDKEELQKENIRLRLGASQVFDDDEQCRKCGTYDDVHYCWHCDIALCIECDPSEMRADFDDHTYCHDHGPEDVVLSLHHHGFKQEDY